jgi:hypothetical protein
MVLSHHDATTNSDGRPPRGTLRSYFVRYRLALYLFSGAVVASGVVLNWNWLRAARVTSHRGISAVHADDVHVHGTRNR